MLLAYLALGLFLLALASIQATRRYEHALGEPDLALPGHWWATVGAVVAVLLVVALVLSWLFVPETLGRLAAAVAAVLALVGQIVAWLIMVISYPIFMLLAWLVGLLTMLPLPEQMPVAMAPLSPLAPPTPGCRARVAHLSIPPSGGSAQACWRLPPSSSCLCWRCAVTRRSPRTTWRKRMRAS